MSEGQASSPLGGGEVWAPGQQEIPLLRKWEANCMKERERVSRVQVNTGLAWAALMLQMLFPDSCSQLGAASLCCSPALTPPADRWHPAPPQHSEVLRRLAGGNRAWQTSKEL